MRLAASFSDKYPLNLGWNRSDHSFIYFELILDNFLLVTQEKKLDLCICILYTYVDYNYEKVAGCIQTELRHQTVMFAYLSAALTRKNLVEIGVIQALFTLN